MADEKKVIVDEFTMAFRGIKRYRDAQRVAEEKGRPSTHGAGAVVLSSMLEVYAKAIKEAADFRKAPRGPRSVALLAMRSLPPKVTALIAARTILDSLGKQTKTTMICKRIGMRIEDELRFRHFKRQDPGSYRNAKEQIGRSRSYEYQRRVLIGLMRKNPNVSDYPKQDFQWYVRVGAKLLDIFERTTGMVRTDHKYASGIGKKSTYHIAATPELMEQLQELHERLEVAHPWFLPTVEEPVPWTGWTGGGYRNFDIGLIKGYGARSPVAGIFGDQPPPQCVLDCVNTFQRTPWEVNHEVLTTLTTLWGYPNTPVPGIPLRVAEPEPVRPFDYGKDHELTPDEKELLHVFKVNKARWHEGEVIRTSKLMTCIQTRLAAEELKDHTFYFPYNCDWRGRAYPIPTQLSPQGSDISRGLLRFAEGKRLGNQEALDWFLIVGATHFGVDKVGFAARIDWVKEHHEQILTSADDPLTDNWWMEADEPWQFLSWAFEYARMSSLDSPFDFVSHKVCSVDGSANGLQHFAAMLRDQRGAEAVNLMPSELPADIYQRVADNVQLELQAVALDDEADYLARHWARQWLKSGLVDRKLMKRNTMTVPYGATQRGRRDQIVDYLKEFETLPFEADRLYEIADSIVEYIKRGIDKEVESASLVMDWLRECARLVAQRGLPLRWTSPTGLPIIQKYRHMGKITVQTQLSGGIRLVGRPYKDTIDRKKQGQGVSPNFVHGLDSAHMVFTVNALKTEDDAERIHWSAVHDSFGCHAADAAALNLALREEFVRLYEEHDVLAEWKRDVEQDTGLLLPDPPPRGDYDIWSVLESSFFFG